MSTLIGRLAIRGVEAAAALLLLTLLAVVFLGVVFRAIDRPLAWTDELAQYLLVWTGFAGWIIADHRGSHIRINLLLDRLPDLPRRLVEIVMQLAVAVFGAVLLVKSFGLIQRNLDVEWVSLPLSQALVYVPIPIAGAAVMLLAASRIVAAAAGRPLGQGGSGSVI